jgi:NAD(P)-dependent dehydrogenase (short-subunit alcohol dehydrogenase family)
MHQGGDETLNRRAKIVVRAAAGIAGCAAAAIASRRERYSFRDKSVLITGASRGLGLLLARRFAEEGAKLTLLSRNGESLSAAERELAGTSAKILTVPCDVRDREQAQEAIESAVRLHGSIDVLINNAGIITVGPFEEMELEDFQNAMATHAWGPLYTMSAAIPHMRRQGGGRIVNISSIGGKLAVPHLMPYAMSKFALAGLSDAMRAELRQYGILVTSVFPGLMRTGSHIYTKTKGDRTKEFAWFAFMAQNPLFAISAKRAARQIVEACRKGRPELIISIQANLALMANALLPSLVARASALVNRLILPRPTSRKGDRKAA